MTRSEALKIYWKQVHYDQRRFDITIAQARKVVGTSRKEEISRTKAFEKIFKTTDGQIPMKPKKNIRYTLHVRYDYGTKQKARRGHELHIREIIATIVVAAGTDEDATERLLRDTVRDYLEFEKGFGDISFMEETVMGFEKQETDDSVSDVDVKETGWAH